MTPEQESDHTINLFFDEKLQGLIGVDKARQMAINYATIYVNGKLEEIPQYIGELNPKWQHWIHVKMAVLEKV